jgi:hypothetical protein
VVDRPAARSSTGACGRLHPGVGEVGARYEVDTT